MAKLSARNQIELGRIDYIFETLAFFDNGNVLKNTGFGWKKAGKVKQGLTPLEAYNKGVEMVKDFEKNHPFFANYKKLLIKYGHSKRFLLHTMIKDEGADSDALYTESQDSLFSHARFNLSQGEAQELCQAYNLYMIENKQHKKSKNI
jgi:hypothetical protein